MNSNMHESAYRKYFLFSDCVDEIRAFISKKLVTSPKYTICEKCPPRKFKLRPNHQISFSKKFLRPDQQ